MEPDYLDKLNPEQKAAVVHEGSPLLILAGAGSGKTRVITTKIAYLIREKHIDPASILAVTFTKKAAGEMQERAVAIEPMAAYSQIRTFHSFGAWFLRRYAEEAGLDSSFTVYDDDDMASLLTKAVPSLSKKQAAAAAHKIALAKDYCLGPEDDLSDIDSSGELNEIYSAYQKRLHATGNADFGDLIMLPVKVMEENGRIRAQMHFRFRVIMVDEYQDSNVAQFKLLQILSGVNEDSGTYVCVVGDDDQSIYKFRGAEVQNILNFSTQFPDAQLVRLERNYRSTSKILSAADAVVKNNDGRLGKTLIAERGEGAEPCLVFLENQDKEAAFCAELIKKSCSDKKNPCRYSDWAVLYRTNAQSLGFETEFLHKKIPYAVVGSLKFYEREEIKDSLAYLALAANGRDEIAFRRIVNKPSRGIGEKSQDKITGSTVSAGGELSQNSDLLAAAENNAQFLPKKAAEGIKEFCSMMKEFRAALETNAADEDKPQNSIKTDVKLSSFIQKVIEDSGLLEYHQSQDEIDGTARTANMQELVNSAVLYPCTMKGLLEFLDSIELDRSLASGSSDGQQDAVTLITLHNTKGLEFPRVIITGLENGIFPREDKIGSELEEERRLFYVGITRAKDMLYITSCAERRLYGRTEMMMPSRFLIEAGNVFTVLGKQPLSYRAAGGAGLNNAENADGQLHFGGKAGIMAEWPRGTRIYHDDWGYGQVIACSDESGEVVITVQFETGAKKKFMPEYQSRSLEIIRD